VIDDLFVCRVCQNNLEFSPSRYITSGKTNQINTKSRRGEKSERAREREKERNGEFVQFVRLRLRPSEFFLPILPSLNERLDVRSQYTIKQAVGIQRIISDKTDTFSTLLPPSSPPSPWSVQFVRPSFIFFWNFLLFCWFFFCLSLISFFFSFCVCLCFFFVLFKWSTWRKRPASDLSRSVGNCAF